MRLAKRFYRLLLKLYPAGFREEYSGPLQRQFLDDYAEVRDRREQVRFWLGTVMDVLRSMPREFARELAQDSQHAIRLWRRKPLSTLFAITMLALAVGANVGVFSVLNSLLLRPLPFNQPDRLASLHNFGPPREEFHAWRTRSAYLADASTFDTFEVNIEGVHGAARTRLTETSWNFFSLLGATPVQGRAFARGEDGPGRDAVAVISYGLWQQLFGGDSRVVGSTLRVNGASLIVVGVAPPDFDYPQKSSLWTPTTFDYNRIPKTGSVLLWVTVGRIKPELTWAQASVAFEAEAYARSPQRRQADPVNRPALIRLQDQLAGQVKGASLILMGIVALLLLLACANVANMLLSRALARSNELIVRTALGASRARLTQQLLTESVLLSLVAGIVGLLVAFWVAGVARAVQPAQLSSQTYSVLDWRVLGFATLVSAFTGVLFGVGPAIYASRGDFATSRSITAARRHGRTRNALIATQIAVTIVLSTGSLALGRAFLALLRVDNGYDVRSLVTMNVSLAGTPSESGERAWSYYQQVERRVRAVPGVLSLSATESLPLAVDAFMGGRFKLDASGPLSPLTTVESVAPGYFRTIGASVLFGREFSPEDLRHDDGVVVINEDLARSLGDVGAVIGRLITAERWPARRIVGVVRSIRMSGPAYGAQPQMFRINRTPKTFTFVVKVMGHPRDKAAMVRDAVQSVDPGIPVFDVRTMDERLDAVLAKPRFYATAVTFFGGLGILVAIVGVFGIVSYTVRQRTREMGIRLALGTTPRRLRGTVLRQTLLTIGIGAAAGVALGAGFGRFLHSLVQGADAALMPTSALAVVLTAVVSAFATWMATRDLARLDLAEVLRADSE
jgi:putative ABC transport system permease protein